MAPLRARVSRWLHAAVLFAAIVCIPVHADLIPLSGTTPQHGVAGVPLPNPVVFRVQRPDGSVVVGATVSFATSGGVYAEPGANCGLGSFGEPQSYCGGATGPDGTVSFPRFTGGYAGDFSFPVTAKLGSEALGSATLQFIIDPKGTPAVVAIVSGDNQRVVQGQSFSAPVKVIVTRAGQPVAGAQVYVSGSIVGPDTPVPFNPGSFGFPVNTAADGTVSFNLKADGAVGNGQLRLDFYDVDAGYISHGTGTYTVTNTRGGFDLALQDLWWGGISENGWGLSLVQHGHQLFNVLFAYDDGGNPVWYAQSNPRWNNGFGGQLFGQLYSPTGTPWYAYDASKLVVGDPVGSGFVLFENEAKANFSTYFNVSNGSQTGPSASLVPQDFQRSGISPITGVGDMWWGGPQQNGWGVAIHEHQGVLFIVWFTYDDNGKPMWLVMPGGDWKDATTYAGTIYRTHSAGWRSGYDASRLTVTPVGTFSLKFASQSQAFITVQVDGRTGTLDLVRQPF